MEDQCKPPMVYLYSAHQVQSSNPTNSTTSSTAPKPTKCTRCVLYMLIFALLYMFLCVIILPTFIKFDNFEVPKFQVDSFTVSPLNLTNSSYVTFNWDVVFTIRNPNSTNIYYEGAGISVFYNDTCILSVPALTFYGDEENLMFMKASTGAFFRNVGSNAVSAMGKDWSHRALNFEIRVGGMARINPRRRHLRVSCQDLKVEFLGNTTAGEMVNGPRVCRVVLY